MLTIKEIFRYSQPVTNTWMLTKESRTKQFRDWSTRRPHSTLSCQFAEILTLKVMENFD